MHDTYRLQFIERKQ